MIESELIGTYGFPIFVCLWFMFRTEKIIKENTKALHEISRCLAYPKTESVLKNE